MKIMEVDRQKTWVVLARYRAFSCKPERDGVIRVDDFKQACVMQSDGNVGSKGQSVHYRLLRQMSSISKDYRGRIPKITEADDWYSEKLLIGIPKDY